MRTNTACTIYNIYYDMSTKADKYQRKVIPAVSWENRKARNMLASGGNLSADQAMIYIPLSPNENTFLGAKTWLSLTTKTGYWTLKRGDLVVKGEITQELSSSYLPSALKAAYDDVLEINVIDTFDMGSPNLQHWAVSAK